MRKACPEIVENFRMLPLNGRYRAPRNLSTKIRNITKMHSDNNEEENTLQRRFGAWHLPRVSLTATRPHHPQHPYPRPLHPSGDLHLPQP